jgi:hypothetical protein
MLATTWKTPACSHMQEMRRQLWCLFTTLATSRAPIFTKLQKKINKPTNPFLILIKTQKYQTNHEINNNPYNMGGHTLKRRGQEGDFL